MSYKATRAQLCSYQSVTWHAVQVATTLPEYVHVGLITFGTHVHVYELGFSECSKCYVFRWAVWLYSGSQQAGGKTGWGASSIGGLRCQ